MAPFSVADPDRLDRAEPGLDQQFELALVAETGNDPAIAGRVGPGHQQPACGDELPLEAEVVLVGLRKLLARAALPARLAVRFLEYR